MIKRAVWEGHRCEVCTDHHPRIGPDAVRTQWATGIGPIPSPGSGRRQCQPRHDGRQTLPGWRTNLDDCYNFFPLGSGVIVKSRALLPTQLKLIPRNEHDSFPHSWNVVKLAWVRLDQKGAAITCPCRNHGVGKPNIRYAQAAATPQNPWNPVLDVCLHIG
jgi:hypothetical protein